MQTFDDVKFISREVKLIYGKKTREKCFDTLYGESIENVGNRNTRPVVAKGSDDSVLQTPSSPQKLLDPIFSSVRWATVVKRIKGGLQRSKLGKVNTHNFQEFHRFLKM